MLKEVLKKVDFELPVSVFRQGDVFVAYTPTLDMSTYGSSKVEARKNFAELVDTFFSSFDDARELALVLESLGWTKTKTTWQPPEIIEQKFSLPASLVMA